MSIPVPTDEKCADFMVKRTKAAAASSAETEDFRVRSARLKREKMQARLSIATMQVCAEKGRLPIVIDEVVQAGGVARGTFYKYFTSLDELVEAVGTRLADEVSSEALAAMPGVPFGPQGIAAGLRLLLSKAAADHVWASFAVRSNFLTANTVVGRRAHQNLAAGHADGHFVFTLADAALDFVMGSLVEGIRRLLAGGVDTEPYICQLTIHVLQGLGVPQATARCSTEEIHNYFQRHAGTRLSWWSKVPGRLDGNVGRASSAGKSRLSIGTAPRDAGSNSSSKRKSTAAGKGAGRKRTAHPATATP